MCSGIRSAHHLVGNYVEKAVDNNSRNEPGKPVSPYLLRPLRDHQNAQLGGKGPEEAERKGAETAPGAMPSMKCCVAAFSVLLCPPPAHLWLKDG